MLDLWRRIVVDFWAVFAEMSPYLLFGFFVAGLLSMLISRRTVERHLGGPGALPLFKAAIFGVPLPLCSCGVIPVSMSLYKHGAGKGATISFLLSTPQTGVDTIWNTLGRRTALLYLLSVAGCALASGLLLDAIISSAHIHDMAHTHAMIPPLAEYVSAFVLLALLGYGYLTKNRR